MNMGVIKRQICPDRTSGSQPLVHSLIRSPRTSRRVGLNPTKSVTKTHTPMRESVSGVLPELLQI